MLGVTALAPDFSTAMRYWTDPSVSIFIEASFHALALDQPIRPPISRLPL
jgi:hypothetical protein